MFRIDLDDYERQSFEKERETNLPIKQALPCEVACDNAKEKIKVLEQDYFDFMRGFKEKLLQTAKLPTRTLMLEIAPTHILRGVPGDPIGCPGSLALQGCGFRRPFVQTFFIVLNDSEWAECPSDFSSWMARWEGCSLHDAPLPETVRLEVREINEDLRPGVQELFDKLAQFKQAAENKSFA